MRRLCEILFLLCLSPGCHRYADPIVGVMTDPRDGEVYRTVTIGKLTWLSENMRYVSMESKCYDDDEENCTVYGRLYGLKEAEKACPPGWRLPNSQDVASLHAVMHSRRITGIAPDDYWKVKGHAHFSNALGLTILPSGRIDSFGYFTAKGEWLVKTDYHQLHYAASFWLSDMPNPQGIPHWHLGDPMGEAKSGVHTHEIWPEIHKFSVRCVCSDQQS